MEQVNWEEQWALFASDFHDGKAHIDLRPLGGKQTLLLLPGPGFGDLSHPTTQLMLEMMQTHVLGESIFDIGTGSGILALAALLLGARSAVGIDIDEDALVHARKNGELNRLKARFCRAIPKKLPSSVILINMIFSEQKVVRPWTLNSVAKRWIVSGLLASQQDEYLAEASLWGWRVSSQHQRSEWLGWVFEKK